jgi:hypothetical protein
MEHAAATAHARWDGNNTRIDNRDCERASLTADTNWGDGRVIARVDATAWCL